MKQLRLSKTEIENLRWLDPRHRLPVELIGTDQYKNALNKFTRLLLDNAEALLDQAELAVDLTKERKP